MLMYGKQKTVEIICAQQIIDADVFEQAVDIVLASDWLRRRRAFAGFALPSALLSTYSY